ncbi:hypothetical protein [Mesorhizobium sp. NZP2077]|uniref:hypothetical protein n=1 Tax=Mesorhizobium sp. NZP2077 TaxID=2483404 RepID=UPI0015526778|nr:hypothetical protein [Mesorhizobium sp. NZP2077]QKC83276.1 hypothetical protein EB232_18115 [Mesorhizobium sp. NZP2077]QKD16792.1 hypothetical protein HGP13_17895 [Mesorhizobium sp. NZP2077]
MTDFIDIAPLTFTETVRGNEVTVRGVELTDIAQIIMRFPEVAKLFDIKGKAKVDPKAMGTLSVALQAALIAAGVDRIREASAANLTPGERALLISRILLLTVPSPAGPFLEALARLTGKDGAATIGEPGRA